MTVYQALPYLKAHRDEFIAALRDGRYKPQPVKRVEIPKPDGSMRKLGIPTVLDRIVQQGVAQVLTPAFEKVFSDNSFGFRPHRSAQDAIQRVVKLYNQGYHYVIDLDLKAYLNELDKTLARRGHQFVRCADDCNIYVKSKRASYRVLASITKFLEKTLKVTVNQKKTKVGSPLRLNFLGFSLGVNSKGAYARPSRKAKRRVQLALKQLTKRNRGRKLDVIFKEIRQKMLGWLQYYSIGKMQCSFSKSTNGYAREFVSIFGKCGKSQPPEQKL